MIKCGKCGKQIIFKTKYCLECGNVLKNVQKVLNVKLFKDSLVKIIGDVFECYDSIINLFGGQCQII